MKRSALAATITLAALCPFALADLPNMPPIKEGLWKIHSVDTYSDQPAQDTTVYLCRSHAYDDSVREMMKKFESQCVISGDSTVGNKRSLTMSCTVSGYKTVTKSTVTMSDNFYRSETEATITASGHTSSNKTVQEQTYMGACPAGMSPGDRKRADGTIEKH
jgi:hypothetical protein